MNLMNKMWLASLLLVGAVACDDDNEGGGNPVEQQVTCELTAPVEGAKVDPAESMKITGTASVNVGAISSVKLTVGGKVVTDVTDATDLPLDYDYVFEPNTAEGPLAIVLEVTGDLGATKSSTVNVTIEKAPVVSDDEFVDKRDNKVYKTVTIGTQTWMAENLAYLPQVNKPSESSYTDNKYSKFYYVFNYDGNDVAAAKATEEYKKYGVLYNWFAAMDAEGAEVGGDKDAIPSGVQGVCPDGWHLPSQAEWQVLIDYVASQCPDVKGNGWEQSIGLPDDGWHYEDGLKNVWSALAGMEGWSESGNSDVNPDLAEGPRDTFGFNAIPSGDYYPNGSDISQQFKFTSASVDFWLSHAMDAYGDPGGAIITLSNTDYLPKYSKYGNNAARGENVRCIKDAE